MVQFVMTKGQRWVLAKIFDILRRCRILKVIFFLGQVEKQGQFLNIENSPLRNIASGVSRKNLGGIFRIFLKNPSRLKNFLSKGGFVPQPPSDYAPEPSRWSAYK